MRDRIDESKLTALVLGELDEEQARELQAEIEASPLLQQEVAEIRQTVAALEKAFSEEAEPALAASQRTRILSGGGNRFWSNSWLRFAATAAAACLVLTVYLNWPLGELDLRQAIPIEHQRVEHPVPQDSDSERAGTVGEEQSESAGIRELPSQASLPPAVFENESRQRLDQPNAEPTATGGGRQEGKAGQPVKQALELGSLRDGIKSEEVQSFSLLKEQNQQMRLPAGKAVRGVALTAYDRSSPVIDVPPSSPSPDFNTESYDRVDDNPFRRVSEQPLSTFSIDVDTASYANVRRFLNERRLPPKDAVRIEELVNYFQYDYAPPTGSEPFAAHVEVGSAPWNPRHQLVRFGLKGRELEMGRRPAGNFVFLLDVSGSMQPANKLPLLKKAFRLLVEQLKEEDRVAIVVYAGASGLVLPSTSCDQKEKIFQSIENLEAGGSTNGGQGIELAYRTAEENFITGGINRVILATDGDFNVGTTNQGDLTRLIEEKADSGVYLTVLGFGMGNFKDSTLEKLADRGNGNYGYIDTVQEAKKILVEQAGGTLVTIAKDVKIQVEFNPQKVEAYRLIGYENRLLRNEDFNDDTKDAGEIGAGHTVTVLYELVPKGVEVDLPPAVDPLKYQPDRPVVSKPLANELLTLKLRYKLPEESSSRLIEVPVPARERGFAEASNDFRFVAAVAGFGMILRDSEYRNELTLDQVFAIAESAQGTDAQGYRTEFLYLVRKARALKDLAGLE